MAQIMTHRGPATMGRRDRDYNDRDYYDTDTVARREYGGFNFGAAFFGWIVASGIAVMLTALLAAAGSAVALTSANGGLQTIGNSVTNNADTVGLVSGLLMLMALAIAYYAGGYVAGRMSRFDGARQGLGTWLMGLIVAIELGALGAAFGAKYNLLQGLNLPHLPVGQGSLTGAGLVTLLLALAVTLGAAMLGGKTGENYHRKIDEVAVEE
jgi:hypothetical protein